MMLTKIINIVKEIVNSESRVVSFLGTSTKEDRDTDIITADGWETENYKKNPVFLWGHDYSQPPIGRAINLKQTENGLVFDIEFANAETYPFADTIFKLFRDGFMSAVSVGFIPKEMIQDPKTGKRTITKKELLELSAVSVPCNPDALRLAYSKGVFSAEELKSLGVVINVDVSAPGSEQDKSQKPDNKPAPAEKIVIEIMDINAFIPESLAESPVENVDGVSARVGMLIDDNVMTAQAYLFDPEKWTPKTANAWVDETINPEDKEIIENSMKLYASLLTKEPIGRGCNAHTETEMDDLVKNYKKLI